MKELAGYGIGLTLTLAKARSVTSRRNDAACRKSFRFRVNAGLSRSVRSMREHARAHAVALTQCNSRTARHAQSERGARTTCRCMNDSKNDVRVYWARPADSRALGCSQQGHDIYFPTSTSDGLEQLENPNHGNRASDAWVYAKISNCQFIKYIYLHCTRAICTI